jgi:hypothetical protein
LEPEAVTEDALNDDFIRAGNPHTLKLTVPLKSLIGAIVTK